MTKADLPAVILLGGGGHARVVAETLVLCGRAAQGYLAPRAAAVAGHLGPHLGDDDRIAHLAGAGAVFAPATGFVDAAGARRREDLLALVAPERLLAVVHPAAILSPSVRIGAGAFVGPGAILGTGAEVGRGAIVNSGAIIEHDCRIGANTHVASGARMGGGVTVGANVLIGAGGTIRQGVTIGERAMIGAGAVVLRDVPAGVTVTGVPAAIRSAAK